MKLILIRFIVVLVLGLVLVHLLHVNTISRERDRLIEENEQLKLELLEVKIESIEE
jgi:hypothetical protein